MSRARIAISAYRGTMSSGGLGGYLTPLTRELATRGYAVDLFVGPPYPDPLPWARVIRIPNERYWERQWSSAGGAPLDRERPWKILQPLRFFEFAVSRLGFFPETFSFSLRMAQRLCTELCRGVRYTLVHDVQTLGYGLLLLRALGLPCVATVHHPLSVDRRVALSRDRGLADVKGTLTFYPVRSQSRVARRIDALITSSEASVWELAESYQVEPGRIHNLGNGVDLPARGDPRAAPTEPELLFLGRCSDPNKGLEYLLRAMAELPDGINLHVLDGFPEHGPIRALAEMPELAGRVRFDGKLPRSELERRLRQASVLVVPSVFEGFGLPVVEALAVGTPVVATSAGALPEVVERAGAGLCVAPADPAALAKGIRETLADWTRLHRAALASRSRLEAEFGWSAVASRTLEVYQTARENRLANR